MKNSSQKIVIVGATSAIAEQCSRLWVKNAAEIILIGRNQQKTDIVASDLRVRNPNSIVRSIAADFFKAESIQTLVDEITNENPFDIVLIAHGLLPEQKNCENNLVELRDALEVNAISPVLFAEAFAKKMEKTNHGSLAIIGSVAGDRGRKSNYIYGAAKGLIARYAEGLQHRLSHTQVKVILIKPGPTDTPMTAHIKGDGMKLADPISVAKNIVAGIDKSKAVIYAPSKWFLIMMIIRHLPRFIFNKLDI